MARILIKIIRNSVITRWGSQYNALLSVYQNREALRAFARRRDTNDILTEGRMILLPIILETINSGIFWDHLEAILAVLKPINNHQHLSESDRANIGHMVPRWLNIQEAWKELEITSSQYKSVPWDELYTVWKRRFDTQTYPIHFVANMLRPETVTGRLKLDQHGYRIVMDWLHDQAQNELYYRQLLREFNNFRNQSGSLYAGDSLIFDKHFSPADA